jgi:hypothetical protein
LSPVPALTLGDDVLCLDEIEPLENEQATVPFRSLPLYPRQLRCLAEVAAAFGNCEFTRVEVAAASGDYVKGADDVLFQLIHRQFVRVIRTRTPHSTYRLTRAGVELAESLCQEYRLRLEPVRPDAVIDAFCEQLLVALDRILPGGRGTVESAAVLTRGLFVKTTYLRVKRRLIEMGMLREDGWLEITPRGRSYLDLLLRRDPDDVWTLDNSRNLSQRARLRVNFLPFPPRVRALVKKHVRRGMSGTMNSDRERDYRLDQIPYLTEFIRTYLRRHPAADDLAGLTIEDIDAFARTACIRKTGESRATRSVHSQLSAIRTFLTFVLDEQPSLLPATFQPRWLWGRVISRDGRPVLKSDPATHMRLVETEEELELRALATFERDVWHIDALPGVERKGHWPQKVISFDGCLNAIGRRRRPMQSTCSQRKDGQLAL